MIGVFSFLLSSIRVSAVVFFVRKFVGAGNLSPFGRSSARCPASRMIQ
jgi:hypothetical protein